ncbi:uncharacterized protein LOC133797577 isoform X2 [Humulus lupulus]|uniref:uncharacterized protein LOC133797577 isoform X2 n=1 Tax=Humulus lupulus TaxID=3486 RepID=UPI002B417331|nr:uncharacterized protein LOC133797577 isoform X2 [Humulus lupulus]
MADNGETSDSLQERQEQEEALVALIEHRTREVQHLHHRLSYYQSQLEEAEKRLLDSETKLARLRGAVPSKKYIDNGDKSIKLERRSVSPVHQNESSSKQLHSKSIVDNGIKSVKVERRSSSPVRNNENSSRKQLQSKPELLIPAVTPKTSEPLMLSGSKTSRSSAAQASSSVSNLSNSAVKARGDKSSRVYSERETTKTQEKGTKRKFEQKEHKELIPLVRNSSKPCIIRCDTSNHISSQHKRKLRALALCPVNDQLFVTSSGASLLSTTECASQKQRRWPEDIAWHPDGNSLFSAYSADGGDSQISVLDLNRTQGRARVTFLDDKPHVKGIINSIIFMPWENAQFVTGGSDHAVMLWKEKDDNVWKSTALHRNFHSSAVMGVAGMQQKHIVLSVGADKRIIGFDANVGRAEFKHQIESKCMSVLPNPCDFNLFMVHAGTLERQLRLFDIRLRQTEIHAFGWKQESSESQSALINQSWSPDGLYITSGSADPMIHIFDIRYNASKPSQSIRAHHKRVFKAVWLQSLPLLVSISSDLNIGLHKVT